MQAEDLLGRIRDYAVPRNATDCGGAWLRQKGEMRFTPDGPWMPFAAEEWFRGGGIDFRWQAQVRMHRLIRASVCDFFEGGKGELTARIFGLIPVARSRGSATDRGEALRGLAELPWHPLAFGEAPGLSWKALSADRLRARFDDGQTQAEAVFEVNAQGQVCGGSASSRPRMAGKSFVETPWSGIFGEYKLMDGLRVPTTAEAMWHLSEGPFLYWRCRVIEFRVLKP